MKEKTSRREFLMKSGCALTMTALATQMRHFGMMSAMAQSAERESRETEGGANYRALVCVFLAGGNDSNNMVIPNHDSLSVSNYSAYSAARNAQGLAIPQAQLLPITVPRLGSLDYGLHPNLGPLTQNGTTIVNNGIHELWGMGKMAVVTNVGTLVAIDLRNRGVSGRLISVTLIGADGTTKSVSGDVFRSIFNAHRPSGDPMLRSNLFDLAPIP